MELKVILVRILVILVGGAAVVDAKSKSGGGKSSGGKSRSTGSKSSYHKGVASVAPIVAVKALGSADKKRAS
jgi:hypothetical protein